MRKPILVAAFDSMLLTLEKCDTVKNDKIALKGHLRSSKVIDYVTNGKLMYDFLLMNQSKYGLISHRFGDTAMYRLKITEFAYPYWI